MISFSFDKPSSESFIPLYQIGRLKLNLNHVVPVILQYPRCVLEHSQLSKQLKHMNLPLTEIQKVRLLCVYYLS